VKIADMVSESKRAAIRRHYRLLRAAVGKTQLQVERQAKLDAGKFWKIENGVVFPNPDERKVLARILEVDDADLPSAERVEAKAS
jgi:transcriptional regulator with XRE-family HTH domain